MQPTRERRRHVERLVKGEKIAHADLSYEAKRLYVVAALACDESGRISKSDVDHARRDAHLISTAMNILTKCGCPPVEGMTS
jgi:hypothetical protein